MPRLHEGDVVRYHPPLAMEPLIGTVRRVRLATVELYCGTWVKRSEVLSVVRHIDSVMPSPSSISTAMKLGEVATLGTPADPEDAE